MQCANVVYRCSLGRLTVRMPVYQWKDDSMKCKLNEITWIPWRPSIVFLFCTLPIKEAISSRVLPVYSMDACKCVWMINVYKKYI